MRTPGTGIEHLALPGSDQPAVRLGSIEELKNVGFVEAGQPAQGANRGAHVRALEGAEKSDGDAGGFRDLGEREAARTAQLAKADADGGGRAGSGERIRPSRLSN